MVRTTDFFTGSEAAPHSHTSERNVTHARNLHEDYSQRPVWRDWSQRGTTILVTRFVWVANKNRKVRNRLGDEVVEDAYG